MARFYGALVRGELVGRPLLARLLLRDPGVPDTHYGMGVFRFDHSFYPCDDFVGHDGGTAGYDTTAYSTVDGRRQFAVLVNSFTLDERAGDEAAHAAFIELNVAAACR